MGPAESQQPDDWHRRGEADLSAAEILLENEGDPQVAAALVQQGVEKHLKGWLLARGWRLIRTHDLQRLLDDASTYEHGLVGYYPLCERLTGFYYLERYPFSVDTPTEDVVLKVLADAREFVEDLLSRSHE
ncbi:MAG: HEPN domain-containing protein [Thermoplasmata archaeon]|nr:HEPN domain-containing protein [Thermoplasmata archaeon]NIS10427.1 HEPN domain-containing protein [Thermoplasmata archaeon]